MFRRTDSYSSIIITTLVVGLMIVAPALTAGAFQSRQYSDAEKAGFAFYKLSGGLPALESWVTDTNTYNALAGQERERFLREEIERLHDGFRDYDPSKHWVKAEETATLVLPAPEVLQKALAEEEKIPLRLNRSGYHDQFFAYRNGPRWYGVIPEDMKTLERFLVTEDEYDAILRNLNITPRDREADVKLTVYLRPVAADAEQAHTVRGIDVWLLMADRGAFEIWDPEGGKLAWSRNAPWYEPEGFSEIMNLYQKD